MIFTLLYVRMFDLLAMFILQTTSWILIKLSERND